MKLQRTIISIIFSLLASFAHAQIVITELMQSNIDCIMDDINDFRLDSGKGGSVRKVKY